MKSIVLFGLLFTLCQGVFAQAGDGKKAVNAQSTENERLEKSLTLVKAQHLELKKQFSKQQALIDSLGWGLQLSSETLGHQKDSMKVYCQTIETVCTRVDGLNARLARWKKLAYTGIYLGIAGGLVLLVLVLLQWKKLQSFKKQIEVDKDETGNHFNTLNSRILSAESQSSDLQMELEKLAGRHHADQESLHEAISLIGKEMEGKLSTALAEANQANASRLAQVSDKMTAEYQGIHHQLLSLQKKLEILEKANE